MQETLDIQQLAGTHMHTHTFMSRGGNRDGGKALKSKANYQSLSSVLRKQVSFSSQASLARKGHCIRLNPDCLVPSKHVCSDPCIHQSPPHRCASCSPAASGCACRTPEADICVSPGGSLQLLYVSRIVVFSMSISKRQKHPVCE